MVSRDKDEDTARESLAPGANGHPDAPPSYEIISSGHGGRFNGAYSANEKSTQQRNTNTPNGAGVGSTSSLQLLPPSYLSTSSPSRHASKQVRQTILTLIRDLVFNTELPNLLDSCANACRNYHLGFSTLLQEKFIEHHSAIYWAILKSRNVLLSSLLVHATPLSKSTISEIYLACLVTGNQRLFQSLRCRRETLRSEMIPLSTCRGTEALLLDSMPTDEISIREIEGPETFVAEIRINLWQKRLRASGIVEVEFIALGRIWHLGFSSSPSAIVVGLWRVILRLREHSPSTFIDPRLVIDLPPPSSSSTPTANSPEGEDLVSLSQDDTSRSAARSRAPQTIELPLKSTQRLAYSDSNKVESWDDGGSTYTSGILVPLLDGAGAELLYESTPFIGTDGALHVCLEAQLKKPGSSKS